MAHSVPVRDIYEHTEVSVHEESSINGALTALDKDTFRCHRWDNALRHLHANGLADEESVRKILLEGARAFGMWRLSEPALRALVSQVLEKDARASPSDGLLSWVHQSRRAAAAPPEEHRALDLRVARTLSIEGTPTSGGLDPQLGCLAERCEATRQQVGSVDPVAAAKWGIALILIAFCLAYAGYVVWVSYAGIINILSWPIFFARAAGMGAAIITGLMYLTMARSFMKQAYKLIHVNSMLLTVLDGHKDMHVFFAGCLVVAAAIHVMAHLMSTVPALVHGRASSLNGILACANREERLAGWPSLMWLEWPECPLTQESLDWATILFGSTVGISGLVLVALLLLIGLTGRAKARSRSFEFFWYVHNFVLALWPIAMFVHGSNQWIGVGFPLVAFTAFLPVCLYLVDRVARLLRYYMFSGRVVRIANAVIRPGKDGGPAGALTHLTIEKPPSLWSFVPGMYAFICMPEYAPLQWHPFTICSGKNDAYVEFIIAGVGDWTQELAAKCLAAQQAGSTALPRVALDGPYAAPAQSALSRPILVTVGAGVGITPFLSLMSSIISLIEDSSDSEAQALPLKEAHFFWMTRSADEFLFGRKHFNRIANSPRLRQKIHLHLHTTAREPEGRAAAYLFRQAVRRQSKVDRAAFAHEFDAHQVLLAPQLPWCWVNNSELDVMWLSNLLCENSDDEVATSCGTAVEVPHGLEAADESPASTFEQHVVQSSGGASPGSFLDAASPQPAALPFSPTATSRASVPSLPRARSPPPSLAARQAPQDWQQELLRLRQVGPSARKHTVSSLPAAPSHNGQASPPRAGSVASSSRKPRTWTGPGLPAAVLSGITAASEHQRSPLRSSTSGVQDRDPRGFSSDDLEHGLPSSRTTRDEGAEMLVPVAFGRPDFEAELRAIGKHWHCQDKVHIYVCGNDAIVKGLRCTAEVLNAEARKNAQKKARPGAQKYVVTYERFD